MTKAQRIILYSLLLITAIVVLITTLITNFPDGILGLILCIISVYIIIGSIIKLLMLSKKRKNNIIYLLDIIFWLP